MIYNTRIFRQEKGRNINASAVLDELQVKSERIESKLYFIVTTPTFMTSCDDKDIVQRERQKHFGLATTVTV